jgi:hypothetical protein
MGLKLGLWLSRIVFENSVLRGIFGPRRQEPIQSFIKIYAVPHTITVSDQVR